MNIFFGGVSRVLGPKYYSTYGIWALKPYYLGPWTLSGYHPSWVIKVQPPRPCSFVMYLRLRDIWELPTAGGSFGGSQEQG